MNIRRIIWKLQVWLRARQIAKACPKHARLTAQRKEAQRQHKATRDIERRHRAVMNGLLKQ
jgi:hypothetical protein